jgi:hypothetical protein
MTCRGFVAFGVMLLLGAPAGAQGPGVTPAQAADFMGTWVFTMTEPEAFKGSQQTITVSGKDGVLSASLQIGKFPARAITGLHKDGDMLVLTVSHAAQPAMLENGAPIWAVICLVREGDGMRMAQMLERSQTIKRGTGQKQAD